MKLEEVFEALRELDRRIGRNETRMALEKEDQRRRMPGSQVKLYVSNTKRGQVKYPHLEWRKIDIALRDGRIMSRRIGPRFGFKQACRFGITGIYWQYRNTFKEINRNVRELTDQRKQLLRDRARIHAILRKYKRETLHAQVNIQPSWNPA